jgi:hypothetical protein
MLRLGVPALAAALIAVAASSSPVQAVTASPGVPAVDADQSSATPVTVRSSLQGSDIRVGVASRSASGTRTVKGRKGQTLTVTPTSRLAPVRQTVRVSGKRFNETVGIYVGLCVMPRPGSKPTPCGGGVDMDGSTRASAWISSNPPPYGARLATPYKRGGKFSVRITVSPRIGSIDCRRVRCAIVARADHTRANDRSWDVVVPVSFR